MVMSPCKVVEEEYNLVVRGKGRHAECTWFPIQLVTQKVSLQQLNSITEEERPQVDMPSLCHSD